MKPRTLIVMIVLLVACAAYVVIRHADVFKADRRSAAPQMQPLFNAIVSPIRSISIGSSDGQIVSLASVDGKWRMSAPASAPADQSKISPLAMRLEMLQASRSFDPAAGSADSINDSQTGLDKPLWTIRFTGSDGIEHSLMIGKSVPFSVNQTYIRPDGSSKTFVIDHDLASLMQKSPKDYRDRKVLSLDEGEEIVRLSVEGQSSYDLAKTQGKWHLSQPVAAQVDQHKLSPLLSKLAYLTAEGFVSDNPPSLKPYGLEAGDKQLVVRIWTQKRQDKPSVTNTPASATASAVVSGTSDSTTAPAAEPLRQHELIIGKAFGDKQTYAKFSSEPTVFLLNSADAQSFNLKLIDLRDRKLMAFNPADVNKILINQQGQEGCFERSGQTWQMTAPVKGPADAEALGKLLSSMAALQAEDFDSSKKPLTSLGLDQPRCVIRLELTNDRQPLSLAIGSANTFDMTYVSTDLKSPGAALIRSADAKALLAEPANYYSQLLHSEDADITEMVLARKDGTFSLVRGDDGQWRLGSDAQEKIDQDAAAMLLDTAKHLSAEKIVAIGPSVNDRYTKAKDQITLTYTAAEKPATMPAATSAASASTPGSMPSQVRRMIHFAKLDGHTFTWREGQENNPVGELPLRLYDMLSQSLVHTSLWQIEPADIVGLTITTPSDSFELTKDSKGWHVAAAAYVNVDAEKVESYLYVLQSLRAERRLSDQDDLVAALQNQPYLKVELTSIKGNKFQLFLGDPATPTGCPVTSSELKGAYVLSNAAAGRLVKKWKDFQAAQAGVAPPVPPLSDAE